jgi:hypothetical protein
MPTLTVLRTTAQDVIISRAARELRRGRATVRNYVLWGRLHGRVVGGRRFIGRASLDRLATLRAARSAA